jgi:hypothetical protein
VASGGIAPLVGRHQEQKFIASMPAQDVFTSVRTPVVTFVL